MERDRVYLMDILTAAQLALSYVRDETLDGFLSNIQLQDSVIRRLEIIGEAARHVSDETRAASPDLPWRDMIGMRNLLIHEYDDVDLIIVWHTVKGELPLLVALLENRLGG